MPYITELEGWGKLVDLFNKEGYKIECSLSNDFIIEQNKNENYWIEYDHLPHHLQAAMDDFSERHNLNG